MKIAIDRVDVGVRGERDSIAAPVVARRDADAIMSTGLATEASGGRCARERARGSRSASGSTRSPAAAQASAQTIPGPPALVTIADAVAARERLVREQRGDVEQLAHVSGADHAGVAEQRVDGRRREAASSAPVCEAAARAPAARAPALDRDDRLASRPTRRAIRPNLRGLPNDSR